MEINIWPKAWNLPSFDYKCLIIQAYIRFQKAPVTFRYCNNPWKSPNGDYPVLIDGSLPKICGYKNILRHLQLEDLDLDLAFGEEQRAMIEAYKVLIEDKLLPALEYFFWVESKCFTEVVRPTFAKMLVVPLGLYTPIKFRNKITQKFDILYKGLSESEMESKIVSDAKETLNHLSNKLDHKDYILSNRPCSIDAYIFGILSPLLKSNLPIPSLVNHINACSNLVQLVQRINDQYFPASQEEIEEREKRLEDERKKSESSNSNNNGNNNDDSDFPHKKRNMAIAGLICASSFLLYAVLVGVLKFEIARPGGRW